MKPKVFNGPFVRIEANIQMVIESLAGIFDTHAKVRDIILSSILTIFNQKGSLNWTFDGCPTRRSIALSAVYIDLYLSGGQLTLIIICFGVFDYSISAVSERDSYKNPSRIISLTPFPIIVINFDTLIEALHRSDYDFTLNLVL